MSTWKKIKDGAHHEYVCADIPGIVRGHWGPWQETISWEQLSPKWRKEYDWAAPSVEGEFSEYKFVKIQGYWIPVENFTMCLAGGYGYAPDSFTSGTICQIDYKNDCVRLATASSR
jgi:hypothetical protein